MKLLNWIAAIGALIVLPLSLQAAEKKETPESLAGVIVVDATTVKKWLDNGDDFIVLDARKAADYEAGHLPEAELCTVPSDLNISNESVSRSVLAINAYEALKDLEKEIKIVTYCNGST